MRPSQARLVQLRRGKETPTMQKRLALKTETLRTLSTDELADAGGGGTLAYTPGIPSIRLTRIATVCVCVPLPVTGTVVINPSRLSP
jgi:hypothetical protein